MVLAEDLADGTELTYIHSWYLNVHNYVDLPWCQDMRY